MPKPPVKEVQGRYGIRRYRFVVDVGVDLQTRKRKQLTMTFDTPEEAEHELDRILDELSRGVFVYRPKTKLVLPGKRQHTEPAWRLAWKYCSANCLLAVEREEDECECRCQGEYHGLLTDVEVPLPEVARMTDSWPA